MLFSSPPCITWHITNRCNLNCSHCYSRRSAAESEMGMADVLQVVDRIAKANTFKVHFGGGEPFMRPEIVEVTAALARRNISVGVSTNGMLVDESLAERMRAAGLSSAYVSIDSVDPCVHDGIRGRAGAHKKALACARRFVAMGVEVFLCTVISRRNHKDIRALAEFGAANGIFKMNAKIFRPVGNGLASAAELMLSEDEAAQAQASIAAVNKSGACRIIVESCPCKPEHLIVFPNGDVPRCCYKHGPLGNVLRDDLRSISGQSNSGTKMPRHPQGPSRGGSMTRAKCYGFFFLSCFNGYMPFLGLFLATRKGFDNASILQFLALYPIVEGLLEVPAGIFADRVGEKASLMIGTLLRTAALFMVVCGNGLMIVTGQVLLAAGDAFCSGCDHAMLFHYFQGEDYDKVVADCTALSWTAGALAAFSGYFLARVDVTWPFIATGVAFALNIAVVRSLPPLAIHREKDTSAVLRRTLSSLAGNRRLRYWFLVATLLNAAILTGYLSLQALLNEKGFAGAGNGLLYAAVTVFAVLGSIWSKSRRFRSDSADPRLVVLAMGIALAFCFWLIPAATNLAILGFSLCILRVVWGCSGPYLVRQVNASFSDHSIRSTVLSCHALASSVTVSVLLFAFSRVFERVSLSYHLMAALTLALAGAAWVFGAQTEEAADARMVSGAAEVMS